MIFCAILLNLEYTGCQRESANNSSFLESRIKFMGITQGAHIVPTIFYYFFLSVYNLIYNFIIESDPLNTPI